MTRRCGGQQQQSGILTLRLSSRPGQLGTLGANQYFQGSLHEVDTSLFLVRLCFVF